MAREIINATNGVSKKTMINAQNGNPLQEQNGSLLTIVDACIYKDKDRETGEMKECGLLVDENGSVYTTISETAIDFIDQMIDLFVDGEQKLDVKVELRKSKGGRDFIALTIV